MGVGGWGPGYSGFPTMIIPWGVCGCRAGCRLATGLEATEHREERRSWESYSGAHEEGSRERHSAVVVETEKVETEIKGAHTKVGKAA